MIKKFGILAILVTCILICLGGCFEKPVEIQTEIRYSSGSVEICEKLEPEELRVVMSMINGKEFLTNKPDCMFSPDVTVAVDSLTFEVALDGSGYMKILNQDKYIQLTELETDALIKVFDNHGGKFPYTK